MLPWKRNGLWLLLNYKITFLFFFFLLKSYQKHIYLTLEANRLTLHQGKICVRVVILPQKKMETNNMVSDQFSVDGNIGIPCIPSRELHSLRANYIVFSTISDWELQTTQQKPPASRHIMGNIICSRLHVSKIILLLPKEWRVEFFFFIFLIFRESDKRQINASLRKTRSYKMVKSNYLHQCLREITHLLFLVFPAINKISAAFTDQGFSGQLPERIIFLFLFYGLPGWNSIRMSW